MMVVRLFFSSCYWFFFSLPTCLGVCFFHTFDSPAGVWDKLRRDMAKLPRNSRLDELLQWDPSTSSGQAVFPPGPPNLFFSFFMKSIKTPVILSVVYVLVLLAWWQLFDEQWTMNSEQSENSEFRIQNSEWERAHGQQLRTHSSQGNKEWEIKNERETRATQSTKSTQPTQSTSTWEWDLEKLDQYAEYLDHQQSESQHSLNRFGHQPEPRHMKSLEEYFFGDSGDKKDW